MKILLVDNHDSYTYNLFQLLADHDGVGVDVVTNDDPCWLDLDPNTYDAAVISPGPGTPTEPADLGASAAVLACVELPVLGVCLGHQALALLGGAAVTGAPRPRHGYISMVEHTGHALFSGLPNPFCAVRYHSLHVPDPIPECFEVLARADDGLIMALAHRHRPHWGVQFHPESISTTDGKTLIGNFLRAAATVGRTGDATGQGSSAPESARRDHYLTAHIRTISEHVDSPAVARYFDTQHSYWLWLDSAQIIDGTSRYSILAPADGPDVRRVIYHNAGDRRVDVCDAEADVSIDGADILTYLELDLAATTVTNSHRLPFPFKGGYIGVFGYELKSDCGMHSHHHATTPDAVWVRVHRFVVIDHVLDRTYVVALTDPGTPEPTWVRECADAITSEAAADLVGANMLAAEGSGAEMFARSRSDYVARVRAAQRHLHAGNSYEVCLTNTLHLPRLSADPLDRYLALRDSNPAPYAAMLKLEDLVVYCSSPERFLTVSSDGVVESRPIKGTTARSADPAADRQNRLFLTTDAKTSAENLMIVDLVRNDLGRVCRTGTVTVPKYMAVESYRTVHQLVSTVRGHLDNAHHALDAVRASFPPGSMTGAPKLRTTDIIADLETEARGIYSGTLGYLSYDGAADLNVVIRTAVEHADEITIGAGGAIVLDSDPDAEYDEMLLKADALVRVFCPSPEPSNA